jgi:hypothetical protein
MDRLFQGRRDQADRNTRHGREPLAIGDLILTEVLQGFDHNRDFNNARNMLTALTVVKLGGEKIATQAAKNYRALRTLGVHRA